MRYIVQEPAPAFLSELSPSSVPRVRRPVYVHVGQALLVALHIPIAVFLPLAAVVYSLRSLAWFLSVALASETRRQSFSEPLGRTPAWHAFAVALPSMCLQRLCDHVATQLRHGVTYNAAYISSGADGKALPLHCQHGKQNTARQNQERTAEENCFHLRSGMQWICWRRC